MTDIAKVKKITPPQEELREHISSVMTPHNKCVETADDNRELLKLYFDRLTCLQRGISIFGEVVRKFSGNIEAYKDAIARLENIRDSDEEQVSSAAVVDEMESAYYEELDEPTTFEAAYLSVTGLLRIAATEACEGDLTTDLASTFLDRLSGIKEYLWCNRDKLQSSKE